MKLFSILAVTFFAAKTFAACPDLSGSFTCPADKSDSTSEPHELIVSQDEVDGITTYYVTEYDSEQAFVADGNVHIEEGKYMDENGNENGGYKIEMKTVCIKNAIKITQKAEELWDGERFVSNSAVTAQLDAKKNFTVKGSVRYTGGSAKINLKCARNP